MDHDGILATVGNTPLVRLSRLFPDHRVLAKLELFNPGGSIKDRTALSMLDGRIRSGDLVPGRSVVVESSSGNAAIGIAQVCAYHGLRFVCVVDVRTTEQNRSVLRAYGAEVEVVDGEHCEGGHLAARLLRVRELVAGIPHAYWPDQYSNPLNPRAQQRTMDEILDEVAADYLFCATGTCGTLRGCATSVSARGASTRIVAVDAVGSAIFGDTPAPRLIPGHGASVIPAHADPALACRVMHVTDLDCVVGCRELVRTEAVLAGGSSGAVVVAAQRMLPLIPPDAVSVLIFADGGDRYLDTIYSDQWVIAHFGEVSHLWKENR